MRDYKSIVYNTRIGKEISGRKVTIKEESKEEAIKKLDTLVFHLTSKHKDGFAHTEPFEDDLPF